MFELMSEGLFYLISTSAFLLWGIAIFLFNRISVRHIEREMLKEGIEAPYWDKGLGLRVVGYASVVAFPNINRHASTVNIEATKRHSRELDRKLAFFLIITSILFYSLLAVFYFIYAPDEH